MRVFRVILLALLSAIVAAGSAYFLILRPRVRSWGVDPAESDMELPGDDLVVPATAVETRGITIDAPVSAVWPWLVQMGYGRGGWYSYDALDMKGASAEQVLPEFQHIAPGEIMPTHPGGGFLVKSVEPQRALVLFSDTELVRRQAEAAQAEGRDDLPTPGLRASGAMLSASYPDFAASWTFFLQRSDEGGTRLIERFRARTPGSGPASAVLGEIMGTGIVLMTRKQLLGIKARVEGAGWPVVGDEPTAETAVEEAAGEPAEGVAAG